MGEVEGGTEESGVRLREPAARIDFDQIAKPRYGVLLGFADGIGTGAESAPAAGDAAAGRLDQPALLFQLAENAAHHGDRNRMLLAVQQNGQLVLAPVGELARQMQNAFGQCRRPSGRTAAMRAVRTALEGGEVSGIVALLPAIKDLTADPEVAAGEGQVVAAAVVIHPIQAGAGLAAQFFPRARQLARTGKFSIANLHFDTLSSVNNHSERKQGTMDNPPSHRNYMVDQILLANRMRVERDHERELASIRAQSHALTWVGCYLTSPGRY